MSLLRSPTTRALARSGGARAFSAAAARRAATGQGDAHHDDHGHGHGAADHSADTNETFIAPIWRNTLIISTLAFLGYNFLPSPPSIATSPSSDPEYSTHSTKGLPMITKYIQQLTPPAKLWKERNERHLEQTIAVAEEKLLFQEAERPKIRRLRNPGMFENASPHHVGVGTTVDLSDLKVKSELSLVKGVEQSP